MNFCWVVIFAELEVKDIEAKGDTNITLLCGLRFWQTWRRRWRRGLKLPKNVRCARAERDTWGAACCAKKKQEREALFRLSHCKRLTSTQPKPVRNSIMHTASEIFLSIQQQGELWKKNAGSKCNDGKFYCPDKKKHFHGFTLNEW